MPQTYKRAGIVVAIFAVIGVALGFYYNYNPSQHSFFLPCPFKFTTGYHCPGCGSQRAIHQLLHLDFVAAFRLNPLFILSIPLIIYGVGVKIANYIFKTSYRVEFFYSRFFIYGYFSIALIYWVVRNIPYMPFSWLAPTE